MLNKYFPVTKTVLTSAHPRIEWMQMAQMCAQGKTRTIITSVNIRSSYFLLIVPAEPLGNENELINGL